MPLKRRTGAREPNASRPYMPGYGLPRGTKGLLPWRWAETRLARSHNYWLITVKPDSTPHAMLVWGIWVDGHFYFSTGRQSRKARNLAVNRACIVATERADEAVIVEGTAVEVTDAARFRYARCAVSAEVSPVETRSEPGARVRGCTARYLRHA